VNANAISDLPKYYGAIWTLGFGVTRGVASFAMELKIDMN